MDIIERLTDVQAVSLEGNAVGAKDEEGGSGDGTRYW